MKEKLHIGIIMDGNRRWGKKHLITSLGEVYKKGAVTLSQTVEAALKLNEIKYLTVYAFSTENWERDKNEINNIKNLIEFYLDTESKNLIQQKIKFQVIGDYEKFGSNIYNKIVKLQEATENFDELILNVTLNYGSKQEILRAVNLIQASNIKEEITEETFNSYLYTKNLPNLDLIIRTGGEKRLSNFLLWQASYAELIFLDVLWPEFTAEILKECIQQYKLIDRRKGK